MKKNASSAGLNGLLTPAPDTTGTTAEQTTTGAGTRPICYNLPPVIIEKIRYIAFMEHRKNNAVVSEGLAAYIAKWEKTNGEIPVTL